MNTTLFPVYTSQPFGDAQATVAGSTNSANPHQYASLDPYHYSELDHDTESGLDHAQFRSYNSAHGHWMSPDPYDGSYNVFSPQSFNRYVYAMNRPLSGVDPSGLDYCDGASSVSLTGGINNTGEQPSDPATCTLYGGTWVYTGCASSTTQTSPSLFTTTVSCTSSPEPTVAAPSTGRVGDSDTGVDGGGSTGAGGSGAGSGGSSSPPAPNNGIDASKLKSCLVSSTLDHFGLTRSTLLSGALSIPISKAIVPPYRVIGTPTTNLLSVVGQYAEINVPRVVIAGRGSTNLFRIAGRANPFITTALVAADVAAIGVGTYNCYNGNSGGIGQGGASGGAGAGGDW